MTIDHQMSVDSSQERAKRVFIGGKQRGRNTRRWGIVVIGTKVLIPDTDSPVNLLING
jgi:hypothetical protein